MFGHESKNTLAQVDVSADPSVTYHDDRAWRDELEERLRVLRWQVDAAVASALQVDVSAEAGAPVCVMETDVAVKRHPVGDRRFIARLSGLRIDASAENTVPLLVLEREDTGRSGAVRICRGTGDALAVPDAVAILIEVDMLGGDVDFHEGLSPLWHLSLHGAGGVYRLAGHGLQALNVCNQGFGFLRLIDVPAIVGLDGLRRAVRTLPGLCTGRGIIFISEPLYIGGHLRRIDGYSQALTAIYPGCDRQAVEDLCLIVWQLVGDTHAVHGGELLTDGHGLRR